MSIFNVDKYKYYNPDLQNMTDQECIDHYLNYGIKEDRIFDLTLPDDFNVSVYKRIHKDLKNMTDGECERHYIQHGIHENRRYKFKTIKNFTN